MGAEAFTDCALRPAAHPEGNRDLQISELSPAVEGSLQTAENSQERQKASGRDFSRAVNRL
jgi:hypothetical protein